MQIVQVGAGTELEPLETVPYDVFEGHSSYDRHGGLSEIGCPMAARWAW